jgi:hypothetical protein
MGITCIFLQFSFVLQDNSTGAGKYYVALLDELNQQMISKLRGKLSKEILFLQDNAAPHKAPEFWHIFTLKF